MKSMTNEVTMVSDFLSAWEARFEKERGLFTESLAANKAALFEVLSRTGITVVHVEFNGYGDEGQIESLQAYAGEAEAELPSEEQVELTRITWGGDGESFCSECSVDSAIENLVYDFLEVHLSGWEINEGSFGDFRFNVNDQTITVQCNNRYMQYDHREYVV
jgi:uncharacterized protein DUF6878